MNLYSDTNDDGLDLNEQGDGENTMAVLNTLGGGEDVLAEGEALGLDPNSDKAKISGSSLAVGVVVVIAGLSLFGMRLTLGAIANGGDPVEDITQIKNFLVENSAAADAGADGPISAPDAESARVLEALKQDPTKDQVPAEEVKTNPFDISNVVTRTAEDTANPDTPQENAREAAVKRAKAAAKGLKIDSISGNMAFINGELYRVGDKIGDSGFVLEAVEGLNCKIKTTDEFGITFMLKFR